MNSKNFCIVSGLHTLLQKPLATRFDVKIFLEMDEALRAFLKCKRDHKERNHPLHTILQSMQKRKADGFKYIVPQKKNADIIFQISTATECDLTDILQPIPPLLLTITLKNSLYHEELVRYLIASCGLSVDVELSDAMEEVILKVEGHISSEDIACAVHDKLPEFSDMTAIQPLWHADLRGIMQLIVLYQLLQTLKAQR